MTFKPILHQLTLFDYNQMLLRTRIPIKRITRERYDQALAELRSGKQKKMVEMLQDLREGLENYDRRLTNKRKL